MLNIHDFFFVASKFWLVRNNWIYQFYSRNRFGLTNVVKYQKVLQERFGNLDLTISDTRLDDLII